MNGPPKRSYRKIAGNMEYSIPETKMRLHVDYCSIIKIPKLLGQVDDAPFLLFLFKYVLFRSARC